MAALELAGFCATVPLTASGGRYEIQLVSFVGMDLSAGRRARLDCRGVRGIVLHQRLSGDRPSFALGQRHAVRHLSLLGAYVRHRRLDCLAHVAAGEPLMAPTRSASSRWIAMAISTAPHRMAAAMAMA